MPWVANGGGVGSRICAVIGVFSALVATLLALAPAVNAQAVQPNCATVTGNLVGDCSFEQPALGTTNFTTINAGTPFPDSTTGPWIAGSNGTEIDNTAANGEFNPNSGNQSVDLNSGTTSSVSQNISTQVGHVYWSRSRWRGIRLEIYSVASGLQRTRRSRCRLGRPARTSRSTCQATVRPVWGGPPARSAGRSRRALGRRPR